MPSEQQELQLTVTLDDQASAQLAQIREVIGGLAGNVGGGGGGKGGHGGGIRHTVEGMSEFDKALGGLTRSMLGVGKYSMELAKVMGPLPVALGTMAFQANRASEATESWASEMQKVSNAARRAGTSVGDFSGVVDSLARAGVSAEQAAQMMVRFNQAYGELVRSGSARQRQLVQMAGPEFANNMIQAIRYIGTLRTDVEKFEYIRQLGENVYRNELRRSNDLAEATYKRDQVYAAFGAQELGMVDRAIVAHSKIAQENMNAEAKAMREVYATHTEERQVRERIWSILKGSTASWDIWLVKQITWVEGKLADLLEKEEARSRGKTFAQNFFYFPGITPNITTGAGGSAGGFKAMDRGFIEGGVPGFQHGGIVTAPHIGMVGESGPEAIIPLNRIGELGLGGGEQEKQITNENTQQLQRMALNINRILSDPRSINLGAISVRKLQYGGKSTTNQIAMVGEGGGPEGVTNKYGTNVITGPTIGRLNAGDTVNPLPNDYLTGKNTNKYVSGDTMRAIGESRTGRSSYFGNFQGKYTWRDPGDVYTSGPKKGQPLPAYTGAPPSLPGVAFPTTVTAGPAEKQEGKWFEVTLPNGQTVYAPQTDVGPGKSAKGRVIDINAALAERAGYVPENVKGGQHYPTDAPVTATRVDPERALWMGQPGMPAAGVTPATMQEAMKAIPMPDTSLVDQPIRIPPAEQTDLTSALGDPNVSRSGQGPSEGRMGTAPYLNPATMARMESDRQFFENIGRNPLVGVEREMQAARSEARQAIAQVKPAEAANVVGGFESGGAEGFGVSTEQGENIAKAGLSIYKYLMSPISAVLHETIGRAASTVTGETDTANLTADVAGIFMGRLPSSGVVSLTEKAAALNRLTSVLNISKQTENRAILASKLFQTGQEIIAPATASATQADGAPLDELMSNQIKIGRKGQIKIEQDNPPPGTQIETDGKIFDGATKETTSTPMPEQPPPPRYSPTAAKRQQEQNDAERELRHPTEHAGT